jgi:hypothetical protein
VKDDKNSDNRINQSNSVIGIKLRMAQSDPIKRCPLYLRKKQLCKALKIKLN